MGLKRKEKREEKEREKERKKKRKEKRKREKEIVFEPFARKKKCFCSLGKEHYGKI